jgi:hypothetical protein
MWSLLGSLISSFLLLRDLFGYAIPGAALLGITGYLEVPDYSKLPFVNEPVWLQAVIGTTASYVVGHVLAAIGYLPFDIKIWIDRWRFGAAQRTERNQKVVDQLYKRYLYPSMFIEADRRETLTILRICLSVALIATAFLPHLPSSLELPTLLLGLFMFLNAYVSLWVAGQYGALSRAAADEAKRDNIPFFKWSGGGSSNKDS